MNRNGREDACPHGNMVTFRTVLSGTGKGDRAAIEYWLKRPQLSEVHDAAMRTWESVWDEDPLKE